MAKANVNTASREQLVEAGVRAELADEILKLRRKGKISSLEALDELPGVGPATLAQLRSLLDFRDRTGNGTSATRQEQERGTEEATTPVSRRDQGTDEPARPPRAAACWRSSGRSTPGRGQREVTLQSAEGAAELGQALLDLLQEQARHNLEILTAFARRSTGIGGFRIQTEYLRASLERMAGLNQRYLEAAQAVMTAADVTQDRAEKAA